MVKQVSEQVNEVPLKTLDAVWKAQASRVPVEIRGVIVDVRDTRDSFSGARRRTATGS